jgi:ribosomal protein S18 acetylase RimI-like enzyme
MMKIHQLDARVDGVRSTHLVAFFAEDFAGSVDLLYQDRVSATVKELFVDNVYRGQGIGTALITRCCEIARNGGCETLGLSLAKDNSGAAEFYKKLGFIFAFQYDDGSFVVVKILIPEGIEH